MKVRLNKKNYVVRLCKSGRVQHTHICLACKKEFISNRTTAKYCSDKCKVYYFRNWADLV